MLNLQIAKQRIKQVFEYLKALNEHRNPSIRQIREQPWHLWLDDLPRHASIDLPQRVMLSSEAEAENGSDEPGYLLRVRRPKLTTAPTPPVELRDWLLPGWDDPSRNPDVAESRNFSDENGETQTIWFADDPARLAALVGWTKIRDAWKVAELPARAAMNLFDKFYALNSTLEREGEKYDLVAGDGLLSWQQEDGNIYHPILLQRVQLTFDPKIPEFRIVDADAGSEFHAGLFQSIDDVDPRILRSKRDEFEAGGYHPFDFECTGVLEGFVNLLSAQGTFLGNQRPSFGEENPTVGRAAVVFLRSRTKGYGPAIDSVIESIDKREEFSEALYNIVGFGGSQVPLDGCVDLPLHNHEQSAKDVLFGKPANPEQLKIARTLDRYGSVLVQGPPGTGKSHTIANLIGHLLAHNQSVLVTSHTTKALRVLRELLVENLKPLCVSVLESDLDSRQELEQSVQSISSRLGETDADSLERDAKLIENARLALIEKIQVLQEQLVNARGDEYRDLVYGGKAFSPSDAARIVADGRGVHDWIPGPIALGEPCPFNNSETQSLYATNESTFGGDEECVELPLPDTNDLPTPQDVLSLFQVLDGHSDGGHLISRYWSNPQDAIAHRSHIDRLITQLKSIAMEFNDFDGWKLATIDAGRIQLADGGPWSHLLAKTEEVVELARLVQTDIVVHRPEVVDDSNLQPQLIIANELVKHLSKGGKLSWFSFALHSSWKQMLSKWRVNGQIPETVEQITAIQRFLAVKICRMELRLLWDGLMYPHGAPQSSELGDEPERSASQFSLAIRDALEWWNKKWLPVEQHLCEIGFNWAQFICEHPPDLSRFGEMRRIMDAVKNRLLSELENTKDHLQYVVLNQQLESTVAHLRTFDHPVVASLGKCLVDRNGEAYARSFELYLVAAERRKHAIRRSELLAKMTAPSAKGGSIAEAWAEAIRRRVDVHGGHNSPGDVLKAWEWRQLNDELDRRAEVDLEGLGRQIRTCGDELKRLTNQLIDHRAWVGQIRRTGMAQRQALMGWLSIVSRIGRGFGRRVPLLRREAQRKMEECREAVPVWIMPLSRLVENFDFSEPRFDVVIIDEASQCDVIALLALAIARKVVVVGDDKQVSPSAVGQKLDIIDNLIKLHLDGIPNAVLYDGRMSIYDLAKQSFSGLICLLEHFRCVPDIIQFSNHLSYDGAIKPLREQASSPLLRSMVPYRVEGGSRADGKVNPIEAVTIASLIVAACKHPAYAEMTFGVISLLGDDQAREIERLLLQHLTPDEYARRRIVCGNSAQFQGDERHVVFLSIVDSSGNGPLPTSERDETKQRYNVAASRAQNQTWVVYSLDFEVDLQPRDLRRRLIEHAIDPKAVSRDLEKQLARTESPFEQEVYERLVRQGYRVRPQWQVGRYRIDLVVEGQNGRVAIECDGDRYHSIEKLPEDMERQAILERLGWRFVRIRGSVFFRDREGTMARVFATLDELRVFPTPREVEVELKEGALPDPVDDVIQEAAELRRKWQESESRGDLDIDIERDPRNRVVVQKLVNPFGPTDDRGDSQVESEESETPRIHLNIPSIPAADSFLPFIAKEDAISSPVVSFQQSESSTGFGIEPKDSLDHEVDHPAVREDSSLQNQIVKLLNRQPGLKGREIASILGVDKTEVNSTLHHQLRSTLRKDDEARWWPL